MSRRLTTETLETRTLLAADVMHNLDLATDVDGSGRTTPMDALYVINELNESGVRNLSSGTPPRILGLYYDVFKDDHITPMDALKVMNALQAEGEHDEDIDATIRLEVTNTDGESIESIDVGDTFELNVFVQDHTGRGAQGGVFAAHLDIEFDPALVSTVPADNGGSAPPISLERGPRFEPNRVQGNVDTPGLIDDVGTFGNSIAPVGSDELLLLTFEMTADQAGTATFDANAAEALGRDVLLYGNFDTINPETLGVFIDRIEFTPDSLQINGAFDPPVADDDDYTVNTGDVLIVGAEEGLLVGDTYGGDGALTVDVQTQPANGVLNASPNGAFTYTPNVDFVGNDTFTYVATADGLSSNVATVTIEVVRQNAAPVAGDDTAETDEDNPVSGNVLINDTDDDGDVLTVVLQDDVANGQLSIDANTGGYTYTPDADFNGSDSFTYLLSDGIDTSNLATVTITINPVNDRPVADDDAYDVDADSVLTVAAADGVLVGDSDVDGDILTVNVLTQPANGVLDLDTLDGSFTYTPNAGFSGTDSFTYAANDGLLDSETATVSISVNEVAENLVEFRLVTVNAAGIEIDSIGPGGAFELQVFVEDIGGERVNNGVFAAYLDVIYDDSLVSITGEPSFVDPYINSTNGDTSQADIINELGATGGVGPVGFGSILVVSVPMVADAEGVASFTSNEAEGALDEFDILLYGRDSAVPIDMVIFGATDLEIVAGDSPVAVADSYELDEDGMLVVDAAAGVLANDTDPDSEVLSAVLVEGPENGALQLFADGSFEYTPNENYNGVDTFTYQASDGALLSNVVTVSITVNPVPDAGVPADDFYRLDSLGELTVDAEAGVLANDTDIDGDGLTALLVSQPENGAVTLNEDGSFVYSPNDGFVGRDTFEYRVSSNGLESDVAVVEIEVGDVTPSSITGFVYNDTNNDGVKQAREHAYGNVHIRLRGTDLLGNSIERDVVTSSDGSYRFDDLLQGEYTVTEFQPMHLIDGKDTIGSQLSLRNDRFEIDLLPGVVAGSYNFGERGLEPQFIDDTFFMTTRLTHGLLAMMDASGQLDWYCMDGTWLGSESVDVRLSPNSNVATVTLTSASNASDTEIVTLDVTPDARVLVGNPGDGRLVRLTDSPSSYGLDPMAVDQAFGN